MEGSGRGVDTGTGVEPVADGGKSLLFTPVRAAELLAVRESWLRRKAGRREVPCTFVGKHFRFSAEDLRVIVTGGSRPVRDRWSRPKL
jgi:excisionase family DNA binding protein